jgi:hypothetical protein
MTRDVEFDSVYCHECLSLVYSGKGVLFHRSSLSNEKQNRTKQNKTTIILTMLAGLIRTGAGSGRWQENLMGAGTYLFGFKPFPVPLLRKVKHDDDGMG